jgi:hypothetical protein
MGIIGGTGEAAAALRWGVSPIMLPTAARLGVLTSTPAHDSGAAVTHGSDRHRLSCRVQQDVQEAAFVVGVVVGEILLDVFEGLGEHEQAVLELVELLAGHDQLVFAEAQLGGPLAGLVVALAAGPPAVQPRTARAGAALERPTAPAAPRGPAARFP